MSPKDDDILEFLRDVHPAALPLTVVYWNLAQMKGIGYTTSTVERRLLKLVQVDLVEIPRGKTGNENRYFRITQDGLAYLDGDLKPDELPPDFDASD